MPIHRLTNVLAARRLAQSIDCVVAVVARRHDCLAVEGGPECGVKNARHITSRVVGVSEVLHRPGVLKDVRRDPILPGRSGRPGALQPEGLRVIGIDRYGSAAVGHSRPLPASVVVDAGDEGGPERLSSLARTRRFAWIRSGCPAALKKVRRTVPSGAVAAVTRFSASKRVMVAKVSVPKGVAAAEQSSVVRWSTVSRRLV